jgi:hypothetical protein
MLQAIGERQEFDQGGGAVWGHGQVSGCGDDGAGLPWRGTR